MGLFLRVDSKGATSESLLSAPFFAILISMILRSDYHTHCPLCQHAEGEPEAFVARALTCDLREYGIADHAPMPLHPDGTPFDEWRMSPEQLSDYIAWITRARKAAEGSKLRILAGLECDWIEGIEAWTQELRSRYPWDFLIGSIHYLTDGKSVDDAIYEKTSTTGSVDGDWALYWQRVVELVESGLFDILGHLDLVKIWGRRPTDKPLADYYAPFLDAIEKQPMLVELNVAGWHKPCAEQYPSEELLSALMQRGIPLCIDSDAHSPEQLSRDWDKALTLLQQLANGLGGTLVQRPYTSPHGAQLLALYCDGAL